MSAPVLPTLVLIGLAVSVHPVLRRRRFRREPPHPLPGDLREIARAHTSFSPPTMELDRAQFTYAVFFYEGPLWVMESRHSRQICASKWLSFIAADAARRS